MRRDVAAEVVRLLAKKQADKYVTRSGGTPDLMTRQLAGDHQDVAEDDRKQLRYCLGIVKRALHLTEKRQDNVASCFAFVEAVLDRDYGLSLGRDRDNR